MVGERYMILCLERLAVLIVIFLLRQIIQSKSDDDREAAIERERLAVADAERIRKAVAALEKKIKQVEGDLEVRKL